ncbi:MAG: septum formation protein Maf [Candidatus Pacebacteria bacterium]|nr:septum formation protein Maf [Candidatus Pacearchaeota archaeon]NCQ65829.1 septum formation protein Maf [Candidatus Paceibacterota bacterium]NCS86267.1 septum formation protein Maf [Candidatus Paceibacterota bacterium]
MKKIILASQSPQRKLLMDSIGIDFEVMPANIDEKTVVENNQKIRAQKIAKAKADYIFTDFPEAIIIAADTFTMFNNKAYEKPESMEEAKQMLSEQSGQTGYCYSGFAYIDKQNNINISDIAVTEILFRQLSDFEINKYVTENPVLTWSAGFCPAYPAGANLIATIKGSFTSFTHGMPMEILMPLLERSGVLNEVE